MITIESFQLRLWRSITIRAKFSKDRLDMEALNCIFVHVAEEKLHSKTIKAKKV